MNEDQVYFISGYYYNKYKKTYDIIQDGMVGESKDDVIDTMKNFYGSTLRIKCIDTFEELEKKESAITESNKRSNSCNLLEICV